MAKGKPRTTKHPKRQINLTINGEIALALEAQALETAVYASRIAQAALIQYLYGTDDEIRKNLLRLSIAVDKGLCPVKDLKHQKRLMAHG